MQLHTAPVLFSVLGGIGLFGISGMQWLVAMAVLTTVTAPPLLTYPTVIVNLAL